MMVEGGDGLEMGKKGGRDFCGGGGVAGRGQVGCEGAVRGGPRVQDAA